MNKQAMSVTRQGGQSGFTLIELIVVIVILGILAAVALPRFTNLGGEARLASMTAVRGSLSSVSAMAHGKFLVSSAANVSVVDMEGQTVNLVNGYPAADTNTFNAAGLQTTDYTYIAPGSAATANSPATSATSFAVIPVSVANKPTGLTCFVRYTAATSATNPPTITVPSTNDC